MPLDMSQFEEQFSSEPRFSKLMSNDDFERLAFLNVRIDDITEERDLLKEEVEKLAEGRAQIEEILKVVRALEQNLLKRRKPIDEAIHVIDFIGRGNRRNKEAYERERSRLLAELSARERLIAQRNAIDNATDIFPWRTGTADGKRALKHQLEGAHRLVSADRAILGDKPGLGKTLQAIMTIDMLRVQGKGQKVLIFTPKSVLRDFERAFEKWTNPVFKLVLNQSVKGMQIKTEILEVVKHMPQAIVITNYEVWRKDKNIKAKLIECGFDTVILDEAHMLKGWKSVTTKDIRDIIYAENQCPKCNGSKFKNNGRLTKLCSACEYEQEKEGEFCSVKNVYPMTGTPILNRPLDLFPLLNMLDRNGFPDEKSFLNDYCEKVYDYRAEKYVWTFGDGGSERLLKRLGSKYTARTRDSAGVEMPPQEVKHHYLELDPEKYSRQFKFIEALRDRARLAFSGEHQMTTQGVLAWYTRMRQAASWPDGIQVKGCAHSPECLDADGLPGDCFNPTVIFPPPDAPPVGESVMMDEAEEIIFEAVEDGDRIVVFSMFRSVLAELEKRCEAKGIRHAKIIGGVPDWKRQEFIDDFNTNHTKVGEHRYDVLLCQYQTASVGLNLNGAQQLLCVEREWNPGKEEQTLDRIRRIDSEFNSIVHLLHCAGTATELIDAIQDQKKAMLEGFEADVDLVEAMRKFLEG